ncbi:hypothetical protein E3N88_28855 [Mikania micrantha]|uniref:Large ribosomal subunit protein uL2 C-terminal domain-containing protein n=1 Tax=Mikania micrantha TaxID=192012 RepID=A0A5N6N2A5_9ASTR|nr:hypothetical protein E3N88_28855 [Mikania micrantha]
MEELQMNLQKEFNSVNRKLNIAITRIEKPYGNPNILAEFIAGQLKNRVSFRKAMKKAIELTEQADTKGIQVQIAGRIDGKEIARVEWIREESTSTDMPLGTAIHNIEITLGKGGQLARAAGAVAKLIAKEGKSATLKLPSGEVGLISKNCSATVGQVGNVGVNQKSLGRAGSKRWLGKRPVVRGVVMNPVDHPHGGGEGRAPIGRKKPTTPWGYPALGKRSRKRNKYSDNLILRRRSK